MSVDLSDGVSDGVPILDDGYVGELEMMAGGNHAFLRELLADFVKESEIRLANLERSEQVNPEAAIQDVHFMAGSSAGVGLKRFSVFCRKMESVLKETGGWNPDWVGQARRHHQEGVDLLRARWS